MGVARVGDSHKGVCDHGQKCCPHNVSGTVTSGSSTVTVNGKGVARAGDSVVHNCPHCGTGTIIASTKTVTVGGKLVARSGDTVIYPGGSGTIQSSSSNVSAGD